MARPDVVLERLRENPETAVVVTSAPGKSADFGQKMTDLLIGFYENPEAEKIEIIKTRFYSVCNLVLDEALSRELSESLENDLKTANERKDSYAFIVSRGEHFAARMLAEAGGGTFQETDMMRFDENGNFLAEQTKASIKSLFSSLFENSSHKNKNSGIVVVPGFYGFDDDGSVHLFGRGGSDRSGAILAAALGADEYHNWSDVDGILSADPRIIGKDNVKLLAEVTRREVREGAHGGTGVLMGDTILDLFGSQVEVVMKNTFDSEAPGTRIKIAREFDEKHPVIALAARDDLQEIRIGDPGMSRAHGYVENLLKVVRENGASLEYMPANQDAVSLVLSECTVETAEKIVSALKEYNISMEAKFSTKQVGAVFLVGEALGDNQTAMQTVLETLQWLQKEDKTAEIVTRADSASLAFILERDDVQEVARGLHKLFVE